MWAGKRGVESTDEFLTARSTQEWIPLGTNLFAAGLGVWALFTLPQVGSELGLVGVLAYAVSIVVPIAILSFLGPLIRKKVPEGVTITEFVLARFGWVSHFLTNLVTLLYMTVFLISELTALGFFLEMYGIDPMAAQIVVCVVTTMYTALSGMKASLVTDKFQGWIVLVLMVIVTIAIGVNIQIDTSSADLITPTRMGYESIYTLIMASLAANIFHQGYWQRVYSAKNDKELFRATMLASLLTFPVMFIIGFTGMLAVWMNVSDRNDPLAFFKITMGLPEWIRLVVLMLATAFISSSVDTLQNGIVATVVNDIFMNKLTLNDARIVVALLNVPVVVLATKGFDVLALFLIADLAAAVIVVPVLIGLICGTVHFPEEPSTPDTLKRYVFDAIQRDHQQQQQQQIHRSKSKGQLDGVDFFAGVLGGLASVVCLGTFLSHEKSIVDGFRLLSLPNGLSAPIESMGAFIAAPLGSGVFMLTSYWFKILIWSRIRNCGTTLFGKPTVTVSINTTRNNNNNNDNNCKNPSLFTGSLTLE